MTDKLRTAAQRALEALSMPCDRWNSTQSKIVNDAITALRFALAEQPEEQQREWQGLTEDERNELGKEAIKFNWNDDYAEAIDFVVGKIEAKLKEKNT